MALYQYKPLSPPSHLENTRVLTLDPGQPSDPLSGTLSLLNVNNPTPFEALSYVWGRSTHTETIICDDKPLQITASLALALKRLRYATQPRVIWVDQVCVNQRDLVERSQQVRHMSVIYRKASGVLAWLGEDEGAYADDAFALLKSLTAIIRDELLLEQFKQKQLQGSMDWFPSQNWVALVELFKVPWFDRKWILQEIGTESEAAVFWGHSTIDWHYISEAAVLLKDYGFSLRRQYDLLVWKPWYVSKLFSPLSYEKKTLSFVYELHRARWHKASDPRDHVFALLGHPAAQADREGNRVIEADYEKSVEDVYHDVAVLMLQRGSLMILNTVQHDSLEKAAQRHHLPMWVPQWDMQTDLHNLLGDDTCVYRPSRDILPEPKLVQNNRILQIKGFKIDTVGSMSGILRTEDFTLGSATVADIWKAHAGPGFGEFTTDIKYRTGEPALFAFLETLSAIKKRKAQEAISIKQRLADGSDFLVRSYGSDHTIGPDVREMAGPGECQRWMERVSGGAKCRRFARGVNGYYSLCPPAVQAGDELCMLLGGQTLYCLRPSEGGHLFVGECYVHGVMDGEVLDMAVRGEVQEEEFLIG